VEDEEAVVQLAAVPVLVAQNQGPVKGQSFGSSS